MKTKILSVIILLLGVTTFFIEAQERDFFTLRAKRIVIVDAYKNVDSKLVDFPITLDLSRQRYIIYSNEIQIIDFLVDRKYFKDGYYEVEGKATDSEYKNISFDISVSTTGKNIVIITIGYSNLAYSYTCSLSTD